MSSSCLRVAVPVLLAWIFPAALFAQTLELQPSSITAAPGSSAEVRVILKNSGTDTLRQVSLRQFGNDGIGTEPGKPSNTNAGPSGDVVWPVKITIPQGARLPGAAIFEVSYLAGTSLKHAYVALALQNESIPKPVEVSLEGSPDTISRERPGIIYALITNNTDSPVDVNITHKLPSNAVEIDEIPSFQVPPRSSAARGVEIRAASRVTPGSQPVLIEIHASWKSAGQKEDRDFALTKTVTVGVFFESELLKVLSIPSFLVLPGCLLIFTMQLLLTFGVLNLKDESKLPQLTVTSPAFWILAVTFSGLFAPLYYRLTGVNYLLNYGGDDLRNVWLLSIALGVVIYFVIAGITLRHRQTHVPSNSDGPVTVLKKLARNGLGISRPQVKYKLNTLELNGFLLEDIQDGQNLVWVAPRLTIAWQDTPEAQKCKAEFDRIIDGSRDPAALAGVLERAGTQATVSYESAGVVPNTYHLKVDTITEYLAASLIVG
jgi:hypothetical protein